MAKDSRGAIKMPRTKQYHVADGYYTYDLYENEQNKEVVTIFHGFTGSRKSFNHIAKRLSEFFTVLTIDLPGHGHTVLNEAFSMEGFSKDFNHLLEKENIEKTHLIGYSMGGRTALSFLQYYPEKVSKLILESASPGLKTVEERQERIASDYILGEKIVNQGIESFVNSWENIPLFASQKQLSEEKREEIRRGRLEQSEEGLKASLLYMGTGVQKSWWDKLKGINNELLLITGELDEKFLRINHEMEKNIKRAEHITVGHVGHAVHLEAENVYIDIILDFLRK